MNTPNMSKYQKYFKFFSNNDSKERTPSFRRWGNFIFPVFVVLAAAGLVAYGYFSVSAKNRLPDKEAVRAKAEKFIADNLVAPGMQASIKDMIDENGLYKITVGVGDQETTSYVSKDGKNFFPQVLNMDGGAMQDQAAEQNNQAVGVADVPEVKLFVMSYCPYGLQAEKGILPVVDLLGSKIQFSLEFVDYAMHGEKEIDENLRQYCVGMQGITKISSYLTCFAEQEDSAACLKNAKIDTSALNNCVAATDAQFKIKEKAKDQSLWVGGQYPSFDVFKDDNIKYNVQSSPTLVVNGTAVSPNRDPQSMLAAICSGFSTPPSECDQKLSTDAPSPGFGAGTGSNGNANCGN